MTKSIEVTGKTEEEAIASALAQLGLERDDVSVEILERAKSGFFRIGASPAKIKVSYEVPDEEEPAAEPAPQPAAVKAEPAETVPETVAEAAAEAAPAKVEAPAAPAAAGDAAARTEEFLTGLLERMGSTAKPVVTTAEDGSINVDLVGEGLGALIGRRGETLDAIQHLANYVNNHGSAKRVRISVDAENYRAKREEALNHLAKKVAAKVIKYRKNITLEPMNSYERHVIHTALQDFKGVTTYSMDTEPNRRVVIAYDRATAPRSNNNTGRRNSAPRTSSRPAPAARAADNAAAVPAENAPVDASIIADTSSASSNVREWC